MNNSPKSLLPRFAIFVVCDSCGGFAFARCENLLPIFEARTLDAGPADGGERYKVEDGIVVGCWANKPWAGSVPTAVPPRDLC